MDGDRVGLQFPNNPVADILSIYQFLTGITLVKDTNIFEGAQVSLVTKNPVSKEEAVKLIEATLTINGYAIVLEPDGKSARILPARNQQANAVQFSHGVHFYTSPKDIPDGETIVTYFMKLDYLTPEQAGLMFSGHVGLSVYGRITPVTSPPGLLLTESATVVKQLIAIREAIDIGDKGSNLVTKFIPVKYAEASVVAQIIQATLTAQAQEKDTKGVNTIRGNAATDGRNQPQGQPGQPQQQIIIRDAQGNAQNVNSQTPKPTAQVVADTRLNQVLVISAPDDYTYIASLIAEFDKPLEVAEPFERKLRYAAAVDLLSAIVDLLTDTSGGATQLPGGGSVQQQRTQPQASSSSQLLTGRNTRNTRGGQVTSTTSVAASGDTASSSGGSSTGSRPDVITAPSEDNAPISVLVNKTRVVADPMANAILVMGRKEEIAKVNALLDKLDRKPAQVYLSTVIGQLTLGDGFQLGFDYLSSLKNKNFSAASINTRDDILTGNATTRAIADVRNNIITNAFGPAKGLNLYGAIGDSVEAFVTALESTNKFKVLSRPSVFALNNKKATITSGQSIPVPAQQTTLANGINNNGSTTTTITYRDVVLKLEVVPLINEDGEVSLTISQVNDTVVGSQRVEPNDIPIIGTEQLITAVTVPTGRTIVLGGLISDQKKKDTAGVPFLSRIPGVGNLFKDNSNTTSRSELIIFIQPQVVTDNFSLADASRKEDARTRVGADAAMEFPNNIDPDAKAPVVLEPKKKGFFSRVFGNKPPSGTAPTAPSASSMKK